MIFTDIIFSWLLKIICFNYFVAVDELAEICCFY